MGRNSLQFLLAISLIISANMLYAQRTITGAVKDASNKDALIGASVIIKGTTSGTIADINGKYSFEIPSGKQTIIVSFIGFLAKEIIISANQTSVSPTYLESDAVGLNEVSVIASVAVDRKTPIAVSTINPKLIEEKLGTQEFPEILKSTPSVYVTKAGGGFGDARINIRGFDSQNVAVMINGVPINDMENGKVYWSNWAGLSDVTRSMQVQRGLGASKMAVPSVGGTINILTKTTDVIKGGNINMGVGNNGYSKQSVTLSTGLNDKGWAVTASLAKVKGEGWVDATQFEGYSYFLNISKRINTSHTLSFTVFGAPQTHGQRYDKRAILDYKTTSRGLKYNADWGYKNGQVYNLRRNFYHKPQAILNHFWNINDKTNLSTAFYASRGTGGGTGPYGELETKTNNYKTNEQIDFDRIVAENIARGNEGSESILRTSHNNHTWVGLLTSLSHDLTDNIKLTGGVDFRYYRGEHYRTVTDLLGGEFYLDKDKDSNNPNKAAIVNDKIDYNNDGIVSWAGAFGQAEYSLGKLSTFASGAVSSMTMKRIEFFKNTPEQGQESDSYQFPAYSFKAGANYNLTGYLNAFVNGGYFERQPTFRTLFPQYDNVANVNAVNEKILSFEIGTGLRFNNITANINIYHTKWMDRAYTVSRTSNDNEIVRANIEGIDALHKGIELDATANVTHWLNITGMLSIGDWTWSNDVENVLLFDESNVQLGDPINIYTKGLHVGDAAQTTAAIGVNMKVLKGLKLGVDYNYYANLYAQFDPEDGGGIDSWKMPDYQLLDINVRYNFKFGDFDATFSTKVNNLLNVDYITDGEDGSDHDWKTAKVFYGIGRTWSANFKVKF